MRLTVGSLFSGIGGLDLGLERAGMTVRWQVEIDKNAQRVLRHHWPDTALYEDVREVGGEVERVDLICGGFPCQDLSVAGRRAGLAGKRSGLFHEFMRIASELAPRWLLIENVPGLLSSNGGRDMGTVLGTLGELGYGWAYRVLDAQYFGVAQRRRRVFIVGCLGRWNVLGLRHVSIRKPISAWPYTGLPESHAQRRKDYRHPYGGFGSRGVDADQIASGSYAINETLLKSSGSFKQGTTTKPHHSLDPTFGRRWRNPVSRGENDSDRLRLQRLARGRQPVSTTIAFHSQQDPISTEERTPCLWPLAVAFQESQTGLGEGCVAFEPGSVARNAGPAGESPQCRTLRSNMGDNQPAIRQGMLVRRLTPTECERLQAFPDGWTDGQSDSARYRQLGNAVCVNVAEWIGRRIMAVAS